ncbi:MAG: hypothetical protein ACON42_00880 [Flavobacteriaceae bacterium]
MYRYLSIINLKTFITLGISLAVPYLAYQLQIVYNIDLTLISIAIIFPLVFTIRGAFRRREKAMEHLSRYRAGLKTCQYFFQNSKLSDEKKIEVDQLLNNVSVELVKYLNVVGNPIQPLDQAVDAVFNFAQTNKEEISGGTRQKIYRFLRDVHDGIENLVAIHTHRTPISLKAYCLIFIYIFPIIYTPTIINKIGYDGSHWLTYFVVALSEFILISLYNIQDQMEYPFDSDGLDDVDLTKYGLERE